MTQCNSIGFLFIILKNNSIALIISIFTITWKIAAWFFSDLQISEKLSHILCKMISSFQCPFFLPCPLLRKLESWCLVRRKAKLFCFIPYLVTYFYNRIQIYHWVRYVMFFVIVNTFVGLVDFNTYKRTFNLLIQC